MTLDQDWALVKRCQNGDAKAFNDLYNKYSGKIAGFARKYLGDEHHADDIVQDVFMQVYRKLANFRGDARFSTWLFRVSINACKSKRLSLDRQKRIQDEKVATKILKTLPPGPVEEIDQDELRLEIQQSLRDLSREQQRILLMKTVQKLSYMEIGRVTNQSENQVRGKLYRARKAFRASHEARAKAA
ncbi:MAG: sigma-70 family RNA polymerase sigma factor [Planctomycetota bacterium]|nr:sigma-70 family RNA polymerase sigma factor [Planctomycetota bacterium]